MTLLTYKDIAQLTGISETAIRLRVMRGTFPPPDEKPNRVTALWKESTVRRWMKEKGL